MYFPIAMRFAGPLSSCSGGFALGDAARVEAVERPRAASMARFCCAGECTRS
jgi:hypothetical protein